MTMTRDMEQAQMVRTAEHEREVRRLLQNQGEMLAVAMGEIVASLQNMEKSQATIAARLAGMGRL